MNVHDISITGKGGAVRECRLLDHFEACHVGDSNMAQHWIGLDRLVKRFLACLCCLRSAQPFELWRKIVDFIVAFD